MRYLAILITSILFTSCAEKTKDFGPFSLNMPSTWKYIPQQGIDSYVGLIAIDSVDTLFFNFGPYSNNLIRTKLSDIFEMETVPFTTEEFYRLTDIYQNFRQGNLQDSVHLRPYLTEYYQDTTIQNFPAHIVTPRHISEGITGIFVDSLWHTERKDPNPRLINSLSLVGTDLAPANHYKVLEVLRTLKLKKPTSN